MQALNVSDFSLILMYKLQKLTSSQLTPPADNFVFNLVGILTLPAESGGIHYDD